MSRGNFDLEQKIFCPGEKVGMNPTLRQKKREKEKEHYKVDRYLNIPILGADSWRVRWLCAFLDSLVIGIS